MTTDPFTECEDAAEDAADLWTHQQGYATTGIEWVAFGQGHLAGSAWARDHLAAQEPTDAEVLAALNADYAIRFGPRNFPADSLEPYGDEAVRIMRAALMAAREARHATDE